MLKSPLQFVTGISWNASLIFDLRDWYRSAFQNDAVQFLPAPTGQPAIPVQAVVRPVGRVKIQAGPVRPTPSGWPFSTAVELITVPTPSGLLAFHGRVRTADGGPLLRIPITGAICELTIRCEGYEPFIIPRVVVPKRGGPTETIRAELLPGASVQSGITEVAGGVFRADGTAELLTTVTITIDRQPPVIAETDSMGNWRTQLPAVVGLKPIPAEIVVKTAGQSTKLGSILITPNRANQVPQSVLRGSVRQEKTGDPVNGAQLSFDKYPGRTTQTRADGTWVFHPAIADQLGNGIFDMKIRVTAAGTSKDFPAQIYQGQGNTIPTFQI